MITPLWMRAVAVAAILAAIAGAGWAIHHHIYMRGYDAAKAEYAAAALVAEQSARAKERELQAKLQGAQNAATKRETILRADANTARAAADRLRNDLADFRRQLPSLAEQAVRQYADAASVVFGECTERYQRLAEQADRIDSDRQKLEDAWPK